ncbi:hypothetical protein F5Y02DRAFT_427011 [Annulohypoxylon stygium]|nr:hypothetical protein F5Y02DRAFT_427011 [Annulohypoxylon stygium]
MASSSAQAPAQIPTRTSSKRGREMDVKEEEYETLRLKVEAARKKIKPSYSFDAKFWASVAEVSELSVKLYEAEMHLSITKWKEDEESNDARGWWATPEAHRIVDRVKASHYKKVKYRNQAAQLEKGSPIIPMRLGIGNTGTRKRSKSEQSKFKCNLIEHYDAATKHPKKPKIVLFVHDTATGMDLPKSQLTASHLVPHSLGPDMLVAIFGTNVQGELDTPHNGLLLSKDVETAMDDGAIVIVPDIADDPTTTQIEEWESAGVKQYKWRIVDPEAEALDVALQAASTESPNIMTIRDLDGKRLSFKNDMRPRSRYLYFLFVVAQLRLAWRDELRKDPSQVLSKQLGEGFWATKGRYLQRSFLLALADEIGHDTNFAENIPIEPGDDSDPDYTGVIGVTQYLQFKDAVDSDDEEAE